MMRTYRIYRNKVRLFKLVCKRDSLQYEICPDTDMNYVEVRMDISRSRFRELLDDVDCEIQRETSSRPEVPVISFRTMMQPEKFKRLVAGHRVFRSLSRDKVKFSNI